MYVKIMYFFDKKLTTLSFIKKHKVILPHKSSTTLIVSFCCFMAVCALCPFGAVLRVRLWSVIVPFLYHSVKLV